MTAPHEHGPESKLIAALAAGYDAGRRVAGELAAGGQTDPAQLSTGAMGELVRTLIDAGCLSEPVEKPPAMTLQEAGELLCRLSRTRRLDAPAEDAAQLLAASTGLGMVEYAWTAAQAAGISPADQDRAHEARRLLLTHHGAR